MGVSLYSHDKALFLTYSLGTVIVTGKPLKQTVREKYICRYRVKGWKLPVT